MAIKDVTSSVKTVELRLYAVFESCTSHKLENGRLGEWLNPADEILF